MTALKPLVIVALILAGMFYVWTGQTPKDPALHPAQTSRVETANSQFKADSSKDDLIERIVALEIALTNAQQQRKVLEQRIRQLEEQTTEATFNFTEDQTSTLPQNPEASDPAQDLQETLLQANIAPDIVQKLQQWVDENRLLRLQLRDQAIREGWIDSPQFSERISELGGTNQGIRAEFGDQVYDHYLFASGSSNRVLVSEVFSGSAAALSGIKPGDIIISYASQPIFSMFDLREATVSGEAGEMILVEISRDVQPFTTSVPRGPLGISMKAITINPDDL